MLNRFLSDIHRYRYFLFNCVSKDIKLRFRRSYFGVLWLVLSPLVYFAVLALVFTFVIRAQMENYRLFFLSGLIPWLMINNTIMTMTPSLINNGELMKKVALPKLVFPLGVTLARTVDNMIYLAILIVFYFFSAGTFQIGLLWVIPLFLMITLTTFALGTLLALLNLVLRDTVHIVGLLFHMLFFLTPIIYPVDLIPIKFKSIFYLNPFFYFIDAFHQIFYFQKAPSANNLLFIILFSTVSLLVTLAVFGRIEKRIIRYLSI